MSIAERYFYTWSITYRIYHGQNCRSQIQLRTRTAIAVEKRENVTFGDRCVVWTEGNHSQNCSGQGRRRSADRYSSFPLSVIVTMLHNVYDTEEKRLLFSPQAMLQVAQVPLSLVNNATTLRILYFGKSLFFYMYVGHGNQNGNITTSGIFIRRKNHRLQFFILGPN